MSARRSLASILTSTLSVFTFASAIRRVIYGAPAPKAKRYGETSTPTSSTYYRGMNEDYWWFRQDELVRKCVVSNAYFATTAGYETVLEAEEPEKYRYVKEKIDGLNKTVNMDLALFVAQVKRSVYGKTGFEIVLDEDDYPRQLLSLKSTELKPDIDEDWTLTGYTYKGKKDFYEPEEVLYFTNLQLEADMLGLSDVEPVRSVCQAQHELLRETFPEIGRSLWTPYGLRERSIKTRIETLEAFFDSLKGYVSINIQ